MSSDPSLPLPSPREPSRREKRTAEKRAGARVNIRGLLAEFKAAIFLPNSDPDRQRKIKAATVTLTNCFGNGMNRDKLDLLEKARVMATNNRLTNDIIKLFQALPPAN